MFNGIKNFIMKVGAKLGIVQQLQSLQEHKDIVVPKQFYSNIDTWRNLYKGYHKDIHCVPHFTINGGHTNRTLATMNMPKVVSRDLATLIFNERCEISVSSNDKFEKLIDDVFKENSFNAKFQQQLEYMFAYGGTVAKPYLEQGRIKLSYATADTFIPISWDNDEIKEGLFTSSLIRKGKYYTLLEWHVFEDGVYKVKNELYRSENATTVGRKVELSELYDNLEPVVSFNGVTKPLFVYFKPNESNNLDPTLPLGVSLYANSIDTLKSLDIAFDSYQREFRLGRKRIIVPPQAIRSVVDPSTGSEKRYFDTTDETFEAMNLGDMDANYIKDISFELRVEEHIDAINALLNILALQLGLSTGTFSFDAKGGLKTATEVVSENSKTFRTKRSHENVIEQGITDLIRAIGQLAEAAGIVSYPDDVEVTVQFDDSIIQDRDAITNNQILLLSAGLQTKVDALIAIFGLSTQEAEEKLQRIMQENRMDSFEFQQLRASEDMNGAVE